MNIYNDKELKYKLDNNEIAIVDDVWEFVNLFKDGIVIMHSYRENLIKNIKKKYTAEKFFILEKILEKLFWNLRYKLNGTPKNDIVEFESADMDLIKHKLKEDTYYRSFINKIINIDDNRKKIYYRKMEGSANIFIKNEFNLLTGTILFDKILYEQVMSNKIDVALIKLPEYYFQIDYGFPNLNLCCPLIGSDNFRKNKIHKMFFQEDAEKNWFRLITN